MNIKVLKDTPVFKEGYVMSYFLFKDLYSGIFSVPNDEVKLTLFLKNNKLDSWYEVLSEFDYGKWVYDLTDTNTNVYKIDDTSHPRNISLNKVKGNPDKYRIIVEQCGFNYTMFYDRLSVSKNEVFIKDKSTWVKVDFDSFKKVIETFVFHHRDFPFAKTENGHLIGCYSPFELTIMDLKLSNEDICKIKKILEIC